MSAEGAGMVAGPPREGIDFPALAPLTPPDFPGEGVEATGGEGVRQREPGEVYYIENGWSGCSGSLWPTLTQAAKDGWAHADRLAARVQQAEAERDALRERVEALVNRTANDSGSTDPFGDRWVLLDDLRTALDG